MKPGICPVCSVPGKVAADKIGEVEPCSSCKTPLKSFLAGGTGELTVKFLQVVAASGQEAPAFLESEEFRRKYRPFKKLGEGGMGVVHKAIEIATGRRVAIKSLLFTGSPELTQRFIQEGRILSRLDHQHIVKLIDCGSEGAHHYMVFEMIDGVTLQEELRRSLSLPVKQSLELVAQVLKGLDYAHSLGVIHRDIKPENILLTKFGYAKIADFGLAKSYGMSLDPDLAAAQAPNAQPDSKDALSDSHATLAVSGTFPAPRSGTRKTLAQSSSRTGSGAIMGTPSYMSPEQAQGKPVNHLTDIYSTGIMLWELLAGRPLYKGNDIEEILKKQIHHTPPPASSFNAKVPPYLDDVVGKAIAKSHLDRFQSAKDFGLAISRAVRRIEDVTTSRVAVPPPGSPKPAKLPSRSSIQAAVPPKPAPGQNLALVLTAILLACAALALWAKTR